MIMSFAVPFGTAENEITGDPLPHHLNEDEKADADAVFKTRSASDRTATANFILSPFVIDATRKGVSVLKGAIHRCTTDFERLRDLRGTQPLVLQIPDLGRIN
jgi:hypothetical protein